jgi:CHASE2 domain-containing sensor protein
VTKEENKLEQLRRLDESATKPGTIVALVVGILSTLLLGVGMCCTMVWAGKWFIPGIGIGVIGLCGLGAAYPLYQAMTKKRREKIAPEILRLTEELSQ